MKEKLDTEDLIIARDIAEAEAELERREKEKYEKNQAELKEIADHRTSVVNNSVPVHSAETFLLWLLSLCLSQNKQRFERQYANCIPMFLKHFFVYKLYFKNLANKQILH